MSIGSTIRAGAAYVEVTAETSKLQRNLTSAQAQLQAFGKTCTTVGKDLLMLSGAMAVPLVMAAKSFAGFDDSMRLVQAVTQATDNDFKALTITAQRLGRETSYTAQQVADAMVSLGRMGFAPAEIQAAIADVLNLARATGTELAEAGDIAANSLRIFGLEAGKMGDTADVLTVTANSSAQTLIDLFEALKMGGPQAAAAGESIRETCASLAILANLGIKGSLAGTALRKSFSQFAKVKVQEQLRSVGVETLDANGNLRKMAEIMRDIAKVMQTMPTAEKLAFAEDIFDIRGSLAGLTLTANTDELDAMLAKLLDVEGVAADTAQKMDAGLGGSFRLLMSAVEGAMNAIAAAMNNTLQPFIKKVTDVINVFTQWIEQHQGLVTAFATVVAGSAALGAALIAVGVAAKGVAAGLAVVQTVTKGFAFVQGMCIAQATAMKSSILLIGQAFADYRNVAIPAMVGTEKFCAALGLASSSANRARASIILMSNAEAAATAKSFLAAKWQAMTSALSAFRNSAIAATIATKAQAVAEMALSAKTAVINGWLAMTSALKGMTLASITATLALKAQALTERAMTAGRSIAAAWSAMTTAISGLTVATVSATIATKAHTMAELTCTAATAVLNSIRKAGIVIVAAFTAANLKSVIAVSAVAAGNLLLAAAAKIAAGAMLALTAVMSFIATHPVAIALIALTVILGGVCIALYRAASYTAKLSDEAAKLREKNDQLRKTDEARMERLQQLAQKQRLTNAEMAEARVLAGKLQKKYGDLGISISESTMRITALSNAVSTLKDIELKVKDDESLQNVQRLKELSLKVNLNVSEQNEAAGLIETLSMQFGDLGLEVDRVNKRVIALSDSAKRLAGVQLGIKVTTEDLPKFERLKVLSMKLDLPDTEQKEAEQLITELTARYGDLGLRVNRTTGEIEKLNTVSGSLADIRFKVRGTEDISKLFRLQQLSYEAKLTISGQEEATRLIEELTAKYGALGLGIDVISGKITALNAESNRISAIALEFDGVDDLTKLQRLQSLSLKVNLNTEELAEAEQIILSLKKKYGTLGVRVDHVSGQILNLNASAASLKGLALRVQGEEDIKRLQTLVSLVSDTKLDTKALNEAASLIETLEGKYGSLALTVDRANGSIISLNDSAYHLKAVTFNIQSEIEEPDLPKFKELQMLTLEMNLDDKALARGKTLIAELTRKYGDLGVRVDHVNNKITQVHSLSGKFIELKYKVRGTEDIEKYSRLKDLSLHTNLNLEEQQEAVSLITALEKKYGNLGLKVDNVTHKIVDFTQSVTNLDDIQLRISNTEDLTKLQRLKALSLKTELDIPQQNEAFKLIADLEGKYGSLGVEVDRTRNRIVKLNSVIGTIRELRLKVKGAEDIAKITRLGQLAQIPKLDSDSLAEANTLLSQLRIRYGELGIGIDNAQSRLITLTETQIHFAQAQERIKSGNDPLKKTHLAMLQRLQALAAQEKLTNSEQQEAQSIVNALNGAYGSLGLEIDKITGKLTVATTAQKKLNDAMTEASLAELDAEIMEYEGNIRELQKENQALDSYFNHNLMGQVTGKQDKSIRQQEANNDKILAYRQKIYAARKRKKAIQQGDKGADGNSEEQNLQERIQQEKVQQQKNSDDATNAEKRINDIERRWRRERQSDLENEIQDIIELRDEYKKLLHTMLDFERSKKGNERNDKKIAELERKLANSDKIARDRIAAAKAKATENLSKDVNSYQERFDSSASNIQRQRDERKIDIEIETLMKTDADTGIQRLKQLIELYRKAAESAKTEFDKELQQAKGDGQISDQERSRIDKAHENYTHAESLVDKFVGKLQSAQNGTQEAKETMDNSKTLGSFLAESLNAMLGGGSSETVRTAKATEEMVRQGKQTNKLLKRMRSGGGTVMTYV